jgi:hypothetical protein
MNLIYLARPAARMKIGLIANGSKQRNIEALHPPVNL